ncbi:hypothetical protein APHAL10511_003430 [Amanita phalloides]|nr:hypothetical protein APHAL10511_003430 [Amanita phalloides]
MMQEFAVHLKNATGVQYLWQKWKINCLTHVINLATQSLISTYTNAPYFDAKNPNVHMPTTHNKVGIVHAIAVKECSLLKWKEMWRMIQVKAGVAQPVQLVLNMKVQWSSALFMLDQAE